MASKNRTALHQRNEGEIRYSSLGPKEALTTKQIRNRMPTGRRADHRHEPDRRLKPHLEKVGSGASSVAAFERNDAAFEFLWHYHPEFELTLIVKSRGQRLVGDGIADYSPGDLVLLGPNLPHSWRSGPVKTCRTESHRAVVVHFRPDFLGERFFELPAMAGVAHLLRRAANGLAFGQTETGRRVAASVAKLPLLSPGKRVAALLSVLVELAEEEDAQVLSTLRVKPICRVADQNRIDEICRFFIRNFREEIDFADLAKRFHMDQTSLCRFFRRATGRTMTEYLNELRIGAAAQLLINTDESILDIGFRVGFGNYSNFNRQFKRIKGFGPRTLRREFSLGPAAEHRASNAVPMAVDSTGAKTPGQPRPQSSQQKA